MTLTPFIAQNYGAHEYGRIRDGLRFACGFALFFLLAGGVLFWLFGPRIAPLFCTSAGAREVMIDYMRITAFGLAGVEIHRFSGFCYTGCGRPAFAAGLNVMRFLVFMIPLSLLAAYFGSLKGLFFARLITDVGSGVIAYVLAARMSGRLFKIGVKHERRA